MIVEDWLHASAAARPNDLALAMPGRAPIAFAEIEHRVALLAGHLRALGMAAGDRVVTTLAAGPAFVTLLHALPRLRATLVPLDARSTAKELETAVSRVGARWLVAPSDGPGAGIAASGVRSLRLGPHGDLVFAEGAAAQAGTPAVDPTIDLERVHTVLFTSGTSGDARPIALTARNHLESAQASFERLGGGPGERWLSALPPHHVGGLAVLLRGAILGGGAEIHERFEAEAFATALLRGDVTTTSLVPTTLRRLLVALAGRRVPPSLRAVLLGGAAASGDLLRRAAEAGLPVAPTYGMTEAASQVATARPGDPCVEAGRVGRPLGSTRVRIVRAAGDEAGVDEAGEIWIAGATVSPGELLPDGSLRAITRDGWLRSGDLGAIDARGTLRVLGRRDDVIVTGGENVSPDEVEAALLEHPAIGEAGVAGLPDEEWGQVVAAWVVARADPPSLGEIREWCRVRLAPCKLPRRLFVVDSLPRTSLGKVRRAALRASGLGSSASGDRDG